MNKLINKGSKPLSWIFLGVYVLVFICCLFFMTQYYYINVKSNAALFAIYNSFQTINDLLLYTGVVGIVSFALFCIIGSNYRKKFYKSNLIVNTVGCSVSGIICLVTLILVIIQYPAFISNFEEIVEITESRSFGDMVPTYIPLVLTTIALVIALAYTIFYEIFTVKMYKNSNTAKVVVE